ncbi:transcription elongation factor 1-like isoform X2 [Magnolia sinica]|nr:transcription elongation factor 1-like isoform X2 [Magnolia sinica]
MTTVVFSSDSLFAFHILGIVALVGNQSSIYNLSAIYKSSLHLGDTFPSTFSDREHGLQPFMDAEVRDWIGNMGKRKSRAKPPPKKQMDKLDTVFSCPFCNHGTSFECRIDMKNLIREATCRIRQENFSTTITGMELIAYVQQPEYNRIDLASTGALEGSSSG